MKEINFNDVKVGDYIVTDFIFPDGFKNIREGFVREIAFDREYNTMCLYYGDRYGCYVHQKERKPGSYNTVITEIKTKEDYPEIFL